MSKEAVKEEAPKEPKETKKASAKGKGSDAEQRAALLRAHIMKATGQKPLEATFTTHPHVDSGSLVINTLIGGSPTKDGKGLVCPGYPRRKITEIFGPESSGKTTIALAAAANVQRQGGLVLFIDFEHSLDHGYAQKIGVKFDDTFMLYTPTTMEEGLKQIYLAIGIGADLIIVDSVAAMVPAKELERKLDEDSKVGVVAKKMAETLPKIMTWLATMPSTGSGESKKKDPNRPGTALVLLNQERAAISTGGGHGPETNTAGGKALKFYCAVRLRFQKWKTETVERKDPLSGKKQKFPFGAITGVKVVKAKMDARQGQQANIFIRYGYGLDNYYSIIESGLANGFIRREGAYYSYGETRIQGRDKFRQFLVDNPKVYAEVQKMVADGIVCSSGVAISEEELSDGDELLESVGDLGLDDDDDEGSGAVEETIDEGDAE
jgi:recombination protein RecA